VPSAEESTKTVYDFPGASQYFRSFWGAWRTIAGYEAIHMIRKGQACCGVGLLHHFILGLFAATN
jgi:hypothetical protein